MLPLKFGNENFLTEMKLEKLFKVIYPPTDNQFGWLGQNLSEINILNIKFF